MAVAAEPKLEFDHFSGPTMGTTYSIKAYAPAFNPGLAGRISAELERLNQIFSTYIPDSEISFLNRRSTSDWLSISQEMMSLLRRAEAIGQKSSGAYDITAAPLVQLWGFGAGGVAAAVPPDPQKIERVRAIVGWDRLKLHDQKAQIKKLVGGVSLDLSSIAKGYAVDQIAGLLERESVHRFMIEIGGEVRASGAKPGGIPWRVAVEKPLVGERAIDKVVLLKEMSIATSGNYRNFQEGRSGRFGHILDPRNGHPVDHQLLSATVIADSCAEADGWATALIVLGKEKGMEIAHRERLAIYFVWAEGKTLRRYATDLFKPFLASSSH